MRVMLAGYIKGLFNRAQNFGQMRAEHLSEGFRAHLTLPVMAAQGLCDICSCRHTDICHNQGIFKLFQ